MCDFYKKIIENNKEWVEQHIAEDPNYFKDLAKGQKPPLLWIGCSDSRVPANRGSVVMDNDTIVRYASVFKSQRVVQPPAGRAAALQSSS